VIETLDDGLNAMFGHQRGVLTDGGEVASPPVTSSVSGEDAEATRLG
jgi:hypothetical protein